MNTYPSTYQTAAFAAEHRRQLMSQAETYRQAKAARQGGAQHRRARRRVAVVLRLAAR